MSVSFSPLQQKQLQVLLELALGILALQPLKLFLREPKKA